MRNRKHKLNIKKGYKIVSINPRTEKLRSCVLSDFEEGYIEYKQHHWVSQPLHCGPLTVFENLDDALRFAEGQKRRSLHTSKMFALWSCDYIPSPERRLWTMFYSPFDGTRRVIYRGSHLPPGTRFAQRVRLLNNITTFKP